MDTAILMNEAAFLTSDGDADRRLLEAFRRQGDREAMGQLLHAHAAPAYRLARRLTGNSSDAEDAVQDAFIRCVAHAASYRGDGPVRAWIMVVVANAARQRATAEARLHRREERAMSPTSTDGVDSSQAELHEQIVKALETLSPTYRIPVAMHYLDELSFSDIAAALGAKERAIRTRVSRGVEQLREFLSRRGVAVSAAGIVTAFSALPAGEVPASLGVMVQQAMAKGMVASVGVATTTTVWSFKTIALTAMLVLAVPFVGYVAWLSRATPLVIDRSAVVDRRHADESSAVLDQPITVDVEGPLEEVIFALQSALPKNHRLNFAAPDALFAGIKRSASGSGIYVTSPAPNAALRTMQVRAQAKPIREVLEGMCVPIGLRWNLVNDTIVIDRPLPEGERTRLVDAFKSAHDEATILATAQALADSADTACLRPLLLSLANPGQRADLVVRQLEPLTGGLSGNFSSRALASGTAAWASPIVAWSEDAEVAEAVLKAVERQQESRATVIRTAGHLRLRAIVPGCIALLREGFAPQGAVERIIRSKILSTNTPDRLARAAAYALGWIGDIRAVEPMLEVVTNPDYLYQPNDEAIMALGRLHDPRAVQPLLGIATSKSRWGPMRGEIIQALGQIGDESAVESIAAILLDTSDDEHFVRNHVPSALTRIGTPRAVDLLCKGAQSLRDGDGARHAAIGELGYIGGERIERILLGILPQYFSGTYASSALGHIRNPNLVPQLKEMLRSAKGGDAYRHIADALAAMHLPSAEAALIETIPKADNPLLWCHVQALGGSPESMKVLLAMVDVDKPLKQRRIAVGQLARCGAEGIQRVIALVASDHDMETRLSAMGGFHGRSSLTGEVLLPRSVLQSWLVHPEEHIRARAVSLMIDGGRHESAELIATHGTALQDLSPLVRKAAASSYMMGLSDADRRTLVLQYGQALRSDSDPSIRCIIAERCFFWPLPDLGRQCYTDLADALLAAASNDTDAQVRARAGQTLARMIHALREYKRSSQPDLSTQLHALVKRVAEEPHPQTRAIISKAIDHPKDYLNSEFPWNAAAKVRATKPTTGEGEPSPVVPPASDF